jgi:hypothetical protein
LSGEKKRFRAKARGSIQMYLKVGGGGDVICGVRELKIKRRSGEVEKRRREESDFTKKT